VILAVSTWSGDAFATWGWRIPFALSIILVGVGLWIRLGILETLSATPGQEQDRASSDHRSHQEAAD
jgi:hypothetical protein